MKKKIQKKKRFVILSIFFGILFLILFAFLFIRTQVVSPAKTYHSKILEITMDVPSGYSIDEASVTVTLKKKNNKGEIILFKTGTNIANLDDYLWDITNYNHLQLTNKESLTINGLSAIKVDINGKRSYLIYTKYRVYSLETSSTELYDDLDRIAESFRYEP